MHNLCTPSLGRPGCGNSDKFSQPFSPRGLLICYVERKYEKMQFSTISPYLENDTRCDHGYILVFLIPNVMAIFRRGPP